MQVSEKAAKEWARENKIDNFRVEELFDPKQISRQARGICAARSNTGKRNRIRCLRACRVQRREQAALNDGAVEMVSTPCRHKHFSRRSIFLGHGSMSIQSSHATNSTNGAGECDLYPPVCRRCGK